MSMDSLKAVLFGFPLPSIPDALSGRKKLFRVCSGICTHSPRLDLIDPTVGGGLQVESF
jgi:hypothetical protein